MEKSASEVDAAVGAAVGRVQIVLVNQDDLANGWATPVPYNTIEISVAAPTVESVIGNSPDWLRLVFVHEYTHRPPQSRRRVAEWPAPWLRPAAAPLSQPVSADLGHRRDRHVG